ncbi:MAG: alpha/beta fold hydrolase [Clostridia bacterium]|nr:alpha/beta fold hydrolase [Clostridia bacterium]
MTIMDDGIRLSAVLERPEAERCPLVIVLHGFTSTKDKTHTLAACKAMREAGFATLRFDLYGHGESGGEFRDHTLHKWISNTLTVIGYARRLDFVTGIYLSGHSQGGLTAALAGGMAPDLVRGLILRSPAFMIPRCAREGSLLGFGFDPLRVPDEIRVIKGLTLNGNYIRVAQTVRVEDAMDRFPGPVLILHGDADDVVPPEDSAEAAGRYRNCRLEIIPGETHHFDRSPERMEKVIRDWLTAKEISAFGGRVQDLRH